MKQSIIFVGSPSYVDEKTYQFILDSTKEKWKYITYKGEKTKYQVSNLGKFKNIDGAIRDFSNQSANYYTINLKLKDGKFYNVGLHRLVALTFCKIPKRHKKNGLTFDDLVVNHIDGITHHNAVFNLEWCTQTENHAHAIETGLWDCAGEKCYRATITNEEAKMIVDLLMQGKTPIELAKELDISERIIRSIRAKSAWKEFSKNCEFPEICENPCYSKDENLIRLVCEELMLGEKTDKEIGKKYGFSKEYVRDLRNGKLRQDITKDYVFPKKTDSPKYIETIKKIHLICKELEKGILSDREIGENYGFSREYIRDIRNHKRRKDISSQYNF